MEAPSRPALAVPAGDSLIRRVVPPRRPSSVLSLSAPAAPAAPPHPGAETRGRGSPGLGPRRHAALLALLVAGLPGVPSAGAQGPGPPGDAPGPAADRGEIVLVAGGDVTLGARLEEHLKALAIEDVTLDPHAYPFARIAHHLRAADLALVNLEGPFTARGQRLPKNFNFRASPHLAEALSRAGIAAVSLANNHVMDYGAVGLEDTLAALAHEGIVAFGAGMSLPAARRGAVVERRGIRIGLLGYLFLGDHSIEPAAVFAGPGRPGVAGHPWSTAAVEAMVRQDVGNLRSRVDALVVSFHWGREKRHEPEAYQRRLGRAAVVAGAQLVLGHHPHVIQEIEAYRGGLIAYSLGNFVFGGKWKPDDTDSILLKVRLRPALPAPPAAPAPAAVVAGFEVVPLTLGLYPDAPFQPVELTGEAAARVRARLGA
ncbi:MAG TPA: CapA family protein, partial [Streptosporangiaceae bacterium]|nr:CapA family protein [Streptosporangiaceae bacterium]